MDSKTFQMSYSQAGTQVAAMVLPPLGMVGLLMWFLVRFALTAPDWLVIAFITLTVVGSVAATVYMVLRYANVPCTITLDDEGVTVTLQRWSPFYRFNTLKVGWANVLNAAADLDYNTSKLFYVFKTQQPTRTMMLVSNNAQQLLEFITLMCDHTTRYNSMPTTRQPITQISFYGAAWAKWFTYCAIAVMVAATVFYIINPEAFRTTDLVLYYLFAIPWLANYFNSRRK
jgi:hypothetical protein